MSIVFDFVRYLWTTPAEALRQELPLTEEVKALTLEAESAPIHQANTENVQERIGFVFASQWLLMQGDGSINLRSGVASMSRRLLELDIPFVVVLTGAGLGEGDSIQYTQLGAGLKMANVELGRWQVVALPRPFSYLVNDLELGTKNVLIIGGHGETNVRHLAAECGFSHVWTPTMMQNNAPIDAAKLSAILVWSDSDDWGRDLDMIAALRVENPALPMFVCNEDFDRATGYRYEDRTVSSDVVVHMLKDRMSDPAETSGPWLEWIEQKVQQPLADYCGTSVYKTLEDLLEKLNQWGNLYSSDSEATPPRGTPLAETIYLVTDKPERDLRSLERHEHQRAPGGVRWRTLHVTNSDQRFFSDDGVRRVYNAERTFGSVEDAVVSVLGVDRR